MKSSPHPRAVSYVTHRNGSYRRVKCGRPALARKDAMESVVFTNGTLILPDRLLDGFVLVRDGRIIDVGPGRGPECSGEVIDLAGNYLSPGFVDLHVHGGAG